MTQWEAEAARFLPPGAVVNVGLEHAANPFADLVIGSIDTFVRSGAKPILNPGVLLLDEAPESTPATIESLWHGPASHAIAVARPINIRHSRAVGHSLAKT
jgi:hypothetical protein